MTHLELRKVRLRPGEELRDEQQVEIAPLQLGGQRYIAVPERVPADLTITRTSAGMLFQLHFHARLHGPCFRCLDDAVLNQDLSVREYQAEGPEDAEELTSAYVHHRRLDLSSWARDSIALALPDKILCRDDCAGLCAICGKNLNLEPHTHEEEETDPRWEALAKLRDEL